jgi:hypothetical protein
MEIFDYDNILLLPRKCRVESRSECDAGVELGGRKFRLPVVPANMKTVVDETICVWLAQNNYFYVMHRFDLDNVKFVQDMKAKGLFASISLGVKKPDYATVDTLVELGLTPEYVTIDIAHGHADSVRDMIVYLKQKMPTTFVIAGNVATPEAVIDLENWGADATKVDQRGQVVVDAPGVVVHPDGHVGDLAVLPQARFQRRVAGRLVQQDIRQADRDFTGQELVIAGEGLVAVDDQGFLFSGQAREEVVELGLQLLLDDGVHGHIGRGGGCRGGEGGGESAAKCQQQGMAREGHVGAVFIF